MELELSPLSLPGIDAARPTVIAGPCSAETEEQVLTTARQLLKNGIKIFRAGIWKPRTKPGGFEGVGETGLPWLVRVKEELGMLISTEVATQAHVEAALRHGMDLLWVGARTVVNPFAMQELADALRGVDIPVLVKNPVNPDLELWIGGLQRLNDAGVHRLGAIHRGFSSYDKRLYRNPPLWHLPIELRRRIPNLPIFGDPSHTGGTHRPTLPAGDGFGLRRPNRRKPLLSRCGVERCLSAGDAQCAGLDLRQTCDSRSDRSDGESRIAAQTDRRVRQRAARPLGAPHAHQPRNRSLQARPQYGHRADESLLGNFGQARCTRQFVRCECALCTRTL